jgi:hypothetical protein
MVKEAKETETMLMPKKDTERHNLLGFQLNTFGMDLNKYSQKKINFISSFIE